MIKLNIGCNFSIKHVDTILSLQNFEALQKRGITISGVYGSPGEYNPFGSARPRRREPTDVSMSNTLYQFGRLKNYGIKVYITINTIVPSNHGGRRSILSDGLITWIDSISEYVDGFIVAHPGAVDLISQKTDANIIISTIMNVHQLNQLQFIADRWPNVTRVCTALWRNRDMDWLKQANKIIPIELLANEFCTLGGIECEGLYRQACYINHSTDGNDWNQMDVCTEERTNHPESWLMAKFILPQWMNAYQSLTGVSTFKVTGRTHPASFIDYIGKTYLSGKAKGNLLALWGMLEATYENVDQQEEHRKALESRYPYIPVEEVAMRHSFMSSSCNSSDCGMSCKRCKQLYEDIIQKPYWRKNGK